MTIITIESVIQSLEIGFDDMDERDMDEISWGMQEGVLITGNEAKFIVEILKKHLKNNP